MSDPKLEKAELLCYAMASEQGSEYTTLRNEYIKLERAVFELHEELSTALQGDLENGVAWLNDLASREFKDKYPLLAKWIDKFNEMVEELE